MRFDLTFQMKCKCYILEDDPFPLQAVQRKFLHTTMILMISVSLNRYNLMHIRNPVFNLDGGTSFPMPGIRGDII